jgi:hypothetical protein
MRAYEFLLEDNPDYDEDRFLKSDPGTPIPFPKGTTLVNVSDVYDWYKLGMAVSDLDDADPRTFNKGVPHTVFAFGSEEEEHKMIPLLKRLGFSLHDIDSPEDYQKAIRAEDAIPHLEEMAGEIHGGVRKVLQDKGYEYLGSGVDKQAWLEPGTGQVLIVFGYRKGVADFSPDQRMFIDWITYCNKNKNNPHLPRFSGFESFQFQGKNYIQARMERLNEVPARIKELVSYLDHAADHMGAKDFDAALKRLTFAGNYDEEADEFRYDTVEQIVDFLGGPERAANLLNTVHQVKQFSRQHGYSLDLHSGNYMQRSNGTIVVNDPFVVWLNQ